MSDSHKHDFGDQVKVNAPETEVHGSEATVSGMVQKDDGSWYYAVTVGHIVWAFEEYELLPFLTASTGTREDC